jgi:hypothetical protein
MQQVEYATDSLSLCSCSAQPSSQPRVQRRWQLQRSRPGICLVCTVCGPGACRLLRLRISLRARYATETGRFKVYCLGGLYIHISRSFSCMLTFPYSSTYVRLSRRQNERLLYYFLRMCGVLWKASYQGYRMQSI